MINDFISDALKKLTEKKIEEYKNGEKSFEDIKRNIDEEIENATDQLVEDASAMYIQHFKEVMYPNALNERDKASSFIASIDQVWQEGFIASESLYLIFILLFHKLIFLLLLFHLK